MKKNIVVLSSLVLTLLLALSMTRAVKADINDGDGIWLGPTFSGFDDFYGASVIAYTEGATARVAVIVDRGGSGGASEINVTAVSVVFDWGGNYTLVLSPVFTVNDTISTAAFTVSFTVPSTSTASNMFLHTYTIYVKYNTTLGAAPPFTGGDNDFAVYSTAQASAQTLKQTADSYSEPSGGFTSHEARILWEKGDAELTKGDTSYMLGAFSSAATYYQNAITFYGQAYASETVFDQDYRESQINNTNAQADYYTGLSDYYSKQGDAAVKSANASMIQADAAVTEADAAVRQADAALTNAYGWMSIGIGWVLIGIGAIIYGLRKPKPTV